MKLALIGPQGSGKSTLGKNLSKKYNLPLITMGDILRNPESYPGVKEIMGDFDPHDGSLIDDDKACAIAKIALSSCPDGWILDGLPRKMKQYEIMLRDFKPSMFIILEAPRTVCIERVMKRSLVSPRKDDGTIEDRLELYDKETQPVVDAILENTTVGYTHRQQSRDTTDMEVFDAVSATLDRYLQFNTTVTTNEHSKESRSQIARRLSLKDSL